MPDASRKPTLQPRSVVIEEDWQFIHSVFPEIGFKTYFYGFLISQLARELKQNGITSYHERTERPELANISRFLSNIRLVGEEGLPDDRRGIGLACIKAAISTRDSASDAGTAGGQAKETKGGEEIQGA